MRWTTVTLYYDLNQRMLTLNLLMTTIVAPPHNASKWQMGFNLAFKGLMPHPTKLGGNTFRQLEIFDSSSQYEN